MADVKSGHNDEVVVVICDELPEDCPRFIVEGGTWRVVYVRRDYSLVTSGVE
ncbi:hypothetical protein [Nonomuraea sp. CA-141351]|uniref:hypothetical protein n=1 Tax=Nonomuraea sp. CA-141351 TaxID=3239996 RepID=UPI003D90436A